MRSALLLLILALAAGCGPDVPAGVDPAAQDAWEQWQRNPNPGAVIRLLDANRMAAKDHDNPHDAVGVRYQVRGTEALAARAEAAGDLTDANAIDVRVSDLEEGGLLENYDDVLPGASGRLLAARARMRVLLGRD